ncbi:MAG: formylglycine-generating enzyme family protein [Deltaproteobacteria bacterium]|jgi:formylglycine-generating enzyme required for sulfatase activity|nr:formylglycine-generating enzyme family protein [Deltaproteobacteria bacterium]
MLKTLKCYVWVFVFILILYPYTSITGSDIPTAGQIWKEPVTGMEFVWVPGGCYEMGCGNWTSDCFRDEKPVHEVCVDGFWMGKTEVTQGQWKQVMGENPAEFKKGDNYPVEKVRWADVEKFNEKLSSTTNITYKFRFPTEAEWEYAARSGGKPEKYAGGGDLNRLAWYLGNSNGSTHPVATKNPNGLGLFDMNGNVNEWCADTYKAWAYKRHKRNNPLFKDGGLTKVYRSGGWNSKQKSARCAARSYELGIEGHAQQAVYRSNDLGFRLVRSK